MTIYKNHSWLNKKNKKTKNENVTGTQFSWYQFQSKDSTKALIKLVKIENKSFWSIILSIYTKKILWKTNWKNENDKLNWLAF